MLVLLSRLLKSPSLASVSSLDVRRAPSAFWELIRQLLLRKLSGRSGSSLAIPAIRLKRVLQELQFSEPQALKSYDSSVTPDLELLDGGGGT